MSDKELLIRNYTLQKHFESSLPVDICLRKYYRHHAPPLHFIRVALIADSDDVAAPNETRIKIFPFANDDQQKMHVQCAAH